MVLVQAGKIDLDHIGLDNIFGLSYTPVTGRESMFANLPAKTGVFTAAYAQNVWSDAHNTTYISHAVANRIRKYGSTWRDAQKTVASQRIPSWAFAGSGKWTHPQPGLPVNPVLDHNAVANVVPGGHPDVWDASVLKELTATLKRCPQDPR